MTASTTAAFVLTLACWLPGNPQTPPVEVEVLHPNMVACQTDGYLFLRDARQWCVRARANCKPLGREI